MVSRRTSLWVTMLVLFSFVAGLMGCAPAAQPTASSAEPTKPADAAQPAAPAEATSAPAASSGGQVELRLIWWGSQARHDRTIEVVKLFEQKYPNIKITYEFAGWADYWTKVTTQAAGNNLPDIMQQDYAYISEWSKKGLIIPLDQYKTDGTLKFDDVAPASLEGGIIDGKLYGVNLGNNSQTILVDVDAFKKAGVDLPSQTWTWADFEKITNELHDKLGIPGMSYGMWNDQFFKNIMLTTGQQFYDPSGKKLGFTDPQPLVDYFNMLLRLQKSGAMVSREDEVANKYTVETDPIIKGKAAMAYTNSNQIIAMWNAAGADRNFATFPIPRYDKPANYYKPSMFFSVTANSKHPKEAAMFIDFFNNDLQANEILMAERGVPIAAHIRDGLKPKLEKPQAEMFDFIARLEGNTTPIPAPDPAGHPDVVNNVWLPQVVDPIMYGQEKPEQAMATLMTEANAILAKNSQ